MFKKLRKFQKLGNSILSHFLISLSCTHTHTTNLETLTRTRHWKEEGKGVGGKNIKAVWREISLKSGYMTYSRLTMQNIHLQTKIYEPINFNKGCVYRVGRVRANNTNELKTLKQYFWNSSLHSNKQTNKQYKQARNTTPILWESSPSADWKIYIKDKIARKVRWRIRRMKTVCQWSNMIMWQHANKLKHQQNSWRSQQTGKVVRRTK